MMLVLDASVFFSEVPVERSVWPTQSVVEDLNDFHAKCRVEAYAEEVL